MEKKVTKEEVELALDKHCMKEEILNELFPPEFKVGDKVMVTKIPKSGHWICNDDRRLFTLEGGIENGFFGTGESGHMYGLEGCEFRHATPEEIAAAEWEPNKPYRVLGTLSRDWLVFISSDNVGEFYANGRFSGETEKFDKYEKL